MRPVRVSPAQPLSTSRDKNRFGCPQILKSKMLERIIGQPSFQRNKTDFNNMARIFEIEGTVQIKT